MDAQKPQYMFDPSEKPSRELFDIPLIVATEESVKGYGRNVQGAAIGSIHPLMTVANDAKVTIWHGFANDPDEEFIVKFRGRVVGVKPGFATITLCAAPGARDSQPNA